ncbi:hypothetical protein LguiA_005104 [Lonicera macranthoides]
MLREGWYNGSRTNSAFEQQSPHFPTSDLQHFMQIQTENHNPTSRSVQPVITTGYCFGKGPNLFLPTTYARESTLKRQYA